MSVRLVACVTSVLGVALIVATGCSWGQEPADAGTHQPSTAPQDAANMDELFGNDDPQPKEEPPAGAAAGEEDVAGVAEDGPEMPEQPAPEAAADPRDNEIQQLRSRIASMETDIQELNNQIASLSRQLRDQVDTEQLSRRALGAMAENPQMLSGLGAMLQGKVRLVNDTGEPQVVYINGTPWTVVTGESFVYAPVGTVSFLRAGETEPLFKGIQEWTENEATGQFEVEYRVPEAGRQSSETSVLTQLPNQSR